MQCYKICIRSNDDNDNDRPKIITTQELLWPVTLNNKISHKIGSLLTLKEQSQRPIQCHLYFVYAEDLEMDTFCKAICSLRSHHLTSILEHVHVIHK